jgi:chitin synthase
LQSGFHRFEDQIRSRDVEKQKRNRLRDGEAEAGLDPRNMSDPYAPYPSPGGDGAFNTSSQALPLVSNTSPFQCADLYDDEYDERKSLQSEVYAGLSRFTSQRADSMSNFGTESYGPSQNMFQNTDKKGLVDKEALMGEIQEGETTEVLKESSAPRRWVAICWMLTFWDQTPFLTWFGCMKRLDVRARSSH